MTPMFPLQVASFERVTYDATFFFPLRASTFVDEWCHSLFSSPHARIIRSDRPIIRVIKVLDQALDSI